MCMRLRHMQLHGNVQSILTLTVDGVPCSALEGHVETPPGSEGVEGDTRGKLTVTCSFNTLTVMVSLALL